MAAAGLDRDRLWPLDLDVGAFGHGASLRERCLDREPQRVLAVLRGILRLALAIRGLDDFYNISAAVREFGARHVDYGATLRLQYSTLVRTKTE